jgi:lysophospholipase L1-like esterase
MTKNFKWLLLVSLTFAACSSENALIDANSTDGSPLTAGSADFSNYVALGNSLTAGYCDNALFIEGQKGSWTNLLAQQFSLVGGGEFKIPYMSDNLGGFLLGGNTVQPTRLAILGTLPNGRPNIGYVSGVPQTEITNIQTGPFNNMGVPGAKSFHLVAPGYGNVLGVATGQANPYYVRFASTPSARIIDDAVAQNPTFFSLWIGNNDILSYATSGGIGVNQLGNLNPATYGANDITDPAVFANVYSGLVDAMTANGAKGVVANIPYVTTIPFFTTVPYNPVPLDAATISLLMNSPGGYGAYNAGIQSALTFGLITAEEAAKRTISFHPGSDNAVVIADSYLTNLASLSLPSYRQATADDLMVLPAQNFIGTLVNDNPQQVNGVSVPLADNWVLSKDEIAEIKVAVDAYNESIYSIAQAKGLAFVDANATLSQVNNGGLVYNGYTMTSAFITGNAFSLDGVHPSPKGYALIANKFLEAINEKYGSNFKGVNLDKYRILFPAILN